MDMRRSRPTRNSIAAVVLALLAGTAATMALLLTGVATPSTALARPVADVTVTLPELITGGTDGLPAVLVHDATYRVALRVIATAGTGGVTVAVRATGASMTSCTKALAEIKPMTLHCSLHVNRAATGVRVTVSGKGSGFSKSYATFTHTVR